MSVYYNENDQKAVAWLRELIKAGLIADGIVDDRSIADVQAADLAGFRQCHFFAGIGGWSYALRLAGWPDDRHVWTGSCPCQPFSAAGKRKGEEDERHLWPELRRLVAECKPAKVFGEQVASRAGRAWFAGVRADLEALGYAAGGADLCAASVGAPHIRQRLYWVADSESERRSWRQNDKDEGRGEFAFGFGGAASAVADADSERSQGWGESRVGADEWTARESCVVGRMAARPGEEEGWRTTGDTARRGAVGRMGDASCERYERQYPLLWEEEGDRGEGNLTEAWAGSSGFWSAFDIINCTDGKARRVEPGSFPLAHGVPARVVRLRGYGNAIAPQLAAQFIKASEEAMSMCR